MWLWGEFMALYTVLPTLFVLDVLGTVIIPALVAGALFCLTFLLVDPTFDWRRLWSGARAAKVLPAVALRFAVLAVAIGAVVAAAMPQDLFALPRRNAALWAAIMVGYPMASVYPQEIIYRAFLFQRYGPIFRTPLAMTLASAGAFAYAHIVFGSWVSVAMTAVGGFLFARTYQRSGSLAAASAEHALYGCFVFTIGLGHYFYAGS